VVFIEGNSACTWKYDLTFREENGVEVFIEKIGTSYTQEYIGRVWYKKSGEWVDQKIKIGPYGDYVYSDSLTSNIFFDYGTLNFRFTGHDENGNYIYGAITAKFGPR
jgi:hypothetical protein